MFESRDFKSKRKNTLGDRFTTEIFNVNYFVQRWWQGYVRHTTMEGRDEVCGEKKSDEKISITWDIQIIFINKNTKNKINFQQTRVVSEYSKRYDADMYKETSATVPFPWPFTGTYRNTIAHDAAKNGHEPTREDLLLHERNSTFPASTGRRHNDVYRRNGWIKFLLTSLQYNIIYIIINRVCRDSFY